MTANKHAQMSHCIPIRSGLLRPEGVTDSGDRADMRIRVDVTSKMFGIGTLCATDAIVHESEIRLSSV